MPRGDDERVNDILAAIADIRNDTAGMNLDTFAATPVVVRSVLYSIGVIGEAVKHLGDEFRRARPTVPWRAIASTRDRAVHEYYRINIRRIRQVVTDDLDPLEGSLRGPPGHTPP